MSPDRIRAHCWISGVVQGVGFRFYVQRAARRRAVHGFVRNLSDGRVECAAEGEPTAVEQFVADLWRGPAGAAVRNVEVRWEAPQGASGFGIR